MKISRNLDESNRMGFWNMETIYGQIERERSVEIKCLCVVKTGNGGVVFWWSGAKSGNGYWGCLVGRGFRYSLRFFQHIVDWYATIAHKDTWRAWLFAAFVNDSRTVDVPQIALPPDASLRSEVVSLCAGNVRWRFISVGRLGVETLVVGIFFCKTNWENVNKLYNYNNSFIVITFRYVKKRIVSSFTKWWQCSCQMFAAIGLGTFVKIQLSG